MKPISQTLDRGADRPTDRATQRLLLLQAITGLGNIFELSFAIDQHQFAHDVLPFEDKWQQYNPRKEIARQGLSLTSLDGEMAGVPNLDSLREYNLANGTSYDEDHFSTPTPVFHAMKALGPCLERFAPHLGRSHLIRLGAGGFFPPHRDAFGFGMSCFRILGLCQNCGRDQFVFLHAGERVLLEAGKIYFVETRMEHAVFSFVPNATIMVLNVKITPQSFRALMDSVHIR